MSTMNCSMMRRKDSMLNRPEMTATLIIIMRKSVRQNRKSLSMKLSYRLEIRTIQASIRNWQKRQNSA